MGVFEDTFLPSTKERAQIIRLTRAAVVGGAIGGLVDGYVTLHAQGLPVHDLPALRALARSSARWSLGFGLVGGLWAALDQAFAHVGFEEDRWQRGLIPGAIMGALIGVKVRPFWGSLAFGVAVGMARTRKWL